MTQTLEPEICSLLEVQTHPFVLIDADYRIVGANQAYCDNYGLTRDQVIGRSCHEVSHRSAVPCHQNGEDCPHQTVFRTAKPYEVMHTHFDRHQHPEYVRIKGYPVFGREGLRYLGEAIVRVMDSEGMSCDEMRMIGSSPVFLHCVEQLSRAAESEASVLLTGESGVGKDLAAQYLHKRSPRRGQPFLAINCAAIPESMFEDELFGHERGAFTGCIGRKQGLFEMANGGTLFLDEVGEIPLALQAKLLRVLENGEFRRVGGTDMLRANVRIVSATNRNLLELAQSGRFRLDMYYRIAGIDLHLPSLRERRDDIPALAEVILRRISESGAQRCKLSEQASRKLMAHDFPGNVRELRNILVKAVALCQHHTIDEEYITFAKTGASGYASSVPAFIPEGEPVINREQVLVANVPISTMEATYITDLLRSHKGHRRKVADILGISERTLYRKIKLYGLTLDAAVEQ
jgi:transcriptional regulator with PAS, ATPase and Fis domain